jgi:hypothetical protein
VLTIHGCVQVTPLPNTAQPRGELPIYDRNEELRRLLDVPDEEEAVRRGTAIV